MAIGRMITFSQGCFPDGITFTNQAQIDNFTVNYPGCTNIEGIVTITGDDITNLLGLVELTAVQEKLIIENCPSLTSLNGLNNLVSVGWSLIISNNDNLTSLSALNNLNRINGILEIYNNHALTSLEGLDNIDKYYITDLTIALNSSLSLCNVKSVCDYLSGDFGPVNIYNNGSGCNNPVEVASKCGNSLQCLPKGNYYCITQSDIDNFKTTYPGCKDLEGNLTITGNGITNLSGLSQITSVKGCLAIDTCPALINLSGLGNLTYIGGSLTLDRSGLLKNLTGLEGLTSIEKGIWLRSNNSLTSLTGLENLSSLAGSLDINSNPALTSLAALKKVPSIGGFLVLYGNNTLANLAGLENVTTISENLWIYKNPALSSPAGLENLKTVGSSVEIQENAALASLTGLENLTTIGGHLYIESNPALESLQGLKNLTTISQELSISSNNVLHNTDGLENLTSTGFGFWIGYNDALIDLSGLMGLHSIGGGFIAIYENPSLVSLKGLDEIDPASISELYISDNLSLSTCEVKSVCDYLAGQNSIVTIGTNKSGCNNREEVEAACEASGNNSNYSDNEIAIFPNPSSGQFTINLTLTNETHVDMIILNSQGQAVTTLLDKSLTPGLHQLKWNAEGLPAGVYYCHVNAGNSIKTLKIATLK